MHFAGSIAGFIVFIFSKLLHFMGVSSFSTLLKTVFPPEVFTTPSFKEYWRKKLGISPARNMLLVLVRPVPQFR